MQNTARELEHGSSFPRAQAPARVRCSWVHVNGSTGCSSNVVAVLLGRIAADREADAVRRPPLRRLWRRARRPRGSPHRRGGAQSAERGAGAGG